MTHESVRQWQDRGDGPGPASITARGTAGPDGTALWRRPVRQPPPIRGWARLPGRGSRGRPVQQAPPALTRAPGAHARCPAARTPGIRGKTRAAARVTWPRCRSGIGAADRSGPTWGVRTSACVSDSTTSLEQGHSPRQRTAAAASHGLAAGRVSAGVVGELDGHGDPLADRFPVNTEGLGHRHGDLQAVPADPFRVGRLDRRQGGDAVPHADLDGALDDLQVQQARAGRGARSRPPRAPAVSRSGAPAGGGSTAAASTCSPQPPEPGTSGRRGGRPASPPRVPGPSAGRCCICRGEPSVRRPARQTSPARRNVDHSGNAALVTRSAPGTRRPRCRRADVRIGCAPGTTVSRTPDTQPARQQPWPALPPTRRQARRFRSRHLRPGGTTGPGGGHHPRPFMIAVSVTLRGPGTESDPEPAFGRRRENARRPRSPSWPMGRWWSGDLRRCGASRFPTKSGGVSAAGSGWVLLNASLTRPGTVRGARSESQARSPRVVE